MIQVREVNISNNIRRDDMALRYNITWRIIQGIDWVPTY